MNEPLDRFLTRRGVGTWAAVHDHIQRAEVTVDGQVCKHYHRALTADSRVAVAGREIADAPDASTLICHKPTGLACSHASSHAPLIYDLVPAALRHPNLQTVGRLDRDTTGLLLLTLDGTLLQRIVAPRRRCWKRYQITYRGELAADATARVATGLALDDGTTCRPARLILGAPGTCTLSLCEGLNHQVKRMLRQLGGEVTNLHRDRIGGLELPADLEPGDIRVLTAAALAQVFIHT